MFEIVKSDVFNFIPSSFIILIAKTASPGPVVPVPTLGSWEFVDLFMKNNKNPPGVNFFPASVCPALCPSVSSKPWANLYTSEIVKHNATVAKHRTTCGRYLVNIGTFDQHLQNIQRKILIFANILSLK